MKKRFIALLTALVFAACLIPAAVAEEVAEVSVDPFEEIDAEFESAKTVERYQVVTRPTRVTGWANLRWAPSRSAPLIATYPAKQELTVRKETTNWLLVENMETGDIGFISKAIVAEPGETQQLKELNPTIADNGKTDIGIIDINGAFSLQCKLADGYTIQPIKSASDQMLAVVTSEDPLKPILQLSVAYDEAYASVDRMNDLDDNTLAALEKTFTDADPYVSISYGDTGLGTRLMIARESEDDYLDFLSIYKGYFVECVMVPSPQAEDKHLTDEQVQMCIDFLTEMDFVPVETTGDPGLVAGLKFITNLTDYNAETNTVKGTVMHGVPLPEAEAEALKAGDTLKLGELFEEEIKTLEKDEEGDIVINDYIVLRKYGDEYQASMYDLDYLEPYVTLTLEIPDTLEIIDNIDKETGELLENPVKYTVDEFKEMLAAETSPDFATDNTWVTFDDNGGMLCVEREYSPAQ